jgi:hypothetical protein
MKILVVAGDGVIFRALARELVGAIAAGHELRLATEATAIGAWSVLRQRVRRSGLWRGLDQFAFKVFDMLFLRRVQERQARRQLEAAGAAAEPIPRLGSDEGLAYLRAGGFDIVVCLGTSIVSAQALALARHGFINVHPGVLPAYRGTGNLWAVVNQDWDNIGCTVHWMTEKIDAGALIAVDRLRRVPNGLWEIHITALKCGVASLARLINAGELLQARVDASGQPSRYYGWYGFADYARFKKALGKRTR